MEAGNSLNFEDEDIQMLFASFETCAPSLLPSQPQNISSPEIFGVSETVPATQLPHTYQTSESLPPFETFPDSSFSESFFPIPSSETFPDSSFSESFFLIPSSETFPDSSFSESLFLIQSPETFPTSEASLFHSQPEMLNEMLDLLNQDEVYETNNSSSADHGNSMVWSKIESAFSKVRNCGALIVQFWALVESNGKCLLTTVGQPFAANLLDNHITEYRQRSMEYEYYKDANNKPIEIEHGDPPMVIFSGPPTSAFLNRLPELIVKTSQGGPLVRYGFEKCRLRTFYMLPICFPSQRSSCIGVVECCTTCPNDLQIFYKMNRALEGVGLSVLNVQDRIPYETTNGLKLARDNIQTALRNLCETHDIGLAQVWIPYEMRNHVPFLSSFKDSHTKRILAFKLSGYCADRYSVGSQFSFKEYYDACDIASLQLEEEILLKTLQDYKARFCKSISKRDTDMLLAWPTADDPEANSSALTICMRSNHTNDVVYVFEFIWVNDSNKVILVDALLSTVQRFLPHFNLVSGDALHVIDVENFTDSEIKKLDIFKRKRSLPIPGSMEKGKEQMIVEHVAPLKKKSKTGKISLSEEIIVRQYGNTLEQAAANLQVSRSTLKRICSNYRIQWPRVKAGKKKVYDLHNQSDTKEKDIGAVQEPSLVYRDDRRVCIRICYGNDQIKFQCTLDVETIKEQICNRLGLFLETFWLKYKDEDGDMILIASEPDLICAMNWWRDDLVTEVTLYWHQRPIF